jgi:hypothetical protein
MITEKMVFVLGAGASAPFGFPVGAKLFGEVINHLLQPSDQERICKLASDEFNLEHVASFRETLLHSGQQSVDAFLEYRREFLDVGKAVMATLLVGREASVPLWQPENEKNWMRYLFNLMMSSFDKFGDNPVAFITFNYDRSLEYFLFESIRNTFGKPPEECAKVLEKIPIIHLHGRLGFLPWEGKYSNVTREYAPQIDPDTIGVCMRNIKVIHEDISDGRDKDFERAKTLLRAAEVVFYLGFGFGRLNVERLDLANLNTLNARATALGLKAAELHAITRKANVSSLPDLDCLGLLREYAAAYAT